MAVLFISVIIVISILLILVILAQNSKGGGLSSQFGGSSTSQIMGVKKTGDLLERITWGFAIAILALSLTANVMLKDSPAEQVNTSPNIDRADEKTILPSLDNSSTGTESSDAATESGDGASSEDSND